MEVVARARDGEEALERIEQRKPRVALVDVRMPKLGGIEVTRRAKRSTPDTSILLYTGYGDRAMLTEHRIDIVVARNAGGDSASAKIEAARDLGLPVVMVRRPFIPARDKVETAAEVLRWLGHDVAPTERGV